jgi:hypothetical protein
MKGQIMITKILGSGCKKCNTLGENAKAAAAGEQAEITYFGIMPMPGRVVDEKVLTAEEIGQLS